MRRRNRGVGARSKEAQAKIEHQARIDGMQQDIHDMWPSGAECEETCVEHMRHPCERVPVAGVKGREGPKNAGGRQAPLHPWIGRDVFLVVKDDEGKGTNPPVKCQRDKSEQSTNESGPSVYGPRS